MSGAVATALGILANPTGLNAAATVILGPVGFFGVEVPASLSASTGQQMDQKTQPGGTVFLQAFGVRFKPITWTGYLEGFNALTRSAQLKQLVVAATPVPLIWFDRYLTVVVEDFTPRDEKVNWIPYSITVRVLRDETLPPPVYTPSPAAAATDDTNSATGALVAPAGSPLANQLDSSAGTFSSGGSTYGPVLTAPAGSPLANQLDSTPGTFSSGGYTFGPVGGGPIE